MGKGKYARLIGKHLERVEIWPDRDGITFVLRDGPTVDMETYGDCCSYTWVESIDAPSVLEDATIISMEDIDMPDNPVSNHRQDTDVVAYYGLKIVTTKGHAVLDYRNDSNGYYGGSLNFIGEMWYEWEHKDDN